MLRGKRGRSIFWVLIAGKYVARAGRWPRRFAFAVEAPRCIGGRGDDMSGPTWRRPRMCREMTPPGAARESRSSASYQSMCSTPSPDTRVPEVFQGANKAVIS